MEAHPLSPEQSGCAGTVVGMYSTQHREGQSISFNDTKAGELWLRMKQLASHNLLLVEIKSCTKWEKQLWSGCPSPHPSPSSLSLVILLPLSCALYLQPFLAKIKLHRTLFHMYVLNVQEEFMSLNLLSLQQMLACLKTLFTWEQIWLNGECLGNFKSFASVWLKDLMKII